MTHSNIPLIADLSLSGETRVAVAGDWHANVSWVQKAIPFLARQAPGTRTILHVGDFAFWPGPEGKSFLDSVDYWCHRAGIERVLVTPGNHEDWDRLDEAFAQHPGEAVRFSKAVWALPRGYRFALGSRTFLSFGGGASLDYANRRIGKTWWLTEAPTDEDVENAIAGGPVDVLITHESVNGGTAAVEKILGSNAFGWSDTALAYAAAARDRVTQVWEAVNPAVVVHGHMHVADEIELGDGRRVYSLANDGEVRNMGLLNLTDFGWTWVC
ncbi:metallophosphoesterase [Cryobacterium sp. 10S3]|uniref:metallophosphoesterase family protein n=1 Tax=unclassified Cryobacterium TaxID=2649013 RepID=UPI002AC9905D|nr:MULTISPECIES: metallophosphoesterase [unclassified Cryobacterium]MEB0001674.1 metallophosphoesterase [Cryobacterium sp. RTC2.1]MEB0286705.1 metallophosphoesterase [Cryobacterium sp. 10S3]WPX13174.1 metallophosphoesterase [Cryobacterium sp. 10S3]